ncbi:CD3 antigen, gamma polypeptide, isoform CRA_a, partial [Mus musculus]
EYDQYSHLQGNQLRKK